MVDAREQIAMYKVKTIDFLRRKVPIVVQNENGPCPLLALANVLLLRNLIYIPPNTPEVQQDRLISLVAGHLLDANNEERLASLGDEYKANVQQNIADSMALLPKLATGVDFNIRFNDIRDFEFTSETATFDLLDIRLVHGWLVDPQDVRTREAVAQHSYNELVSLLVNTLGEEAPPHLLTPTAMAAHSRETSFTARSSSAPPAQPGQVPGSSPNLSPGSLIDMPQPLNGQGPQMCTEPPQLADAKLQGSMLQGTDSEELSKAIALSQATTEPPEPSALSCQDQMPILPAQNLYPPAASAEQLAHPGMGGSARLRRPAPARGGQSAPFEADTLPQNTKHRADESAQEAQIEEQSATPVERVVDAHSQSLENASRAAEPSLPRVSADGNEGLSGISDSSQGLPEASKGALDLGLENAPDTASEVEAPSCSGEQHPVRTEIPQRGEPEPIIEYDDVALAKGKMPAFVDVNPDIYWQQQGHRQDAPHKSQTQVNTPASRPLEAAPGDESKRRAEELQLATTVQAFLENTSSQLTEHGLISLHQGLRKNELAILFRNNHLNTIFAHNDAIYILVTDQGYLFEQNVVWERLCDVSGNTEFARSDFSRYVAQPPQQDVRAAADLAQAAFASVIPPRGLTGNTGKANADADADMALAMHLQEQEVYEREQHARDQQKAQGQQPSPRQRQPAARQSAAGRAKPGTGSAPKPKSEKCSIM